MQNNTHLLTYTLVDDPYNEYEEEATSIRDAIKKAKYIVDTYVVAGEITIYDSDGVEVIGYEVN